MKLSAAVIVVSTSAALGEAVDLTGPLIVDWLKARTFEIEDPIVIADGPAVSEKISEELVKKHSVIITTGGTGVSPTDATPEATRPFLDFEIPGLLEELRRVGASKSPRALLTRGLAGFSGETFIMNLPGSLGGVTDGLQLLDTVLSHLLEQRTTGGGHAPRTSQNRSFENE